MMQLPLPDVAETLERERFAAIHRFISEHRTRYLIFAARIEPNRADWRQVWDRLVFAILSANATLNDTIVAYRRARAQRGCANLADLSGMTAQKTYFINGLALDRSLLTVRRRHQESWNNYRIRLTQIPGLALTKASYAASLLYPLTADVACLDTWMQKALLTGTTRFGSLTWPEYRALENIVRRFARRHDISTALAQWMIWDCTRGTITSQEFLL